MFARTLITFLMFFSSISVQAEDWQLLFNRASDGKPIEYDFHSIKTERGLIFGAVVDKH
jgi:hypothetical protein